MRIQSEIDKNIIHSKQSIIEAMKKIDCSFIKVLFVVDQDSKFVATLTDGDIRRAILSGTSTNQSVDAVAFYHPAFITEDDPDVAKRIMDERKISAVPVLNKDAHVVKVYYNEANYYNGFKKSLNIPVVIMAGGKGVRLYPYTKILPKPLIPIGEIPIVERIIRSHVGMGCSEFYMIVNYRKNMIKSYFSDTEYDFSIQFIDEEQPLGTGGGIKLLENRVNNTFILTNCDIVILEDIQTMLKHHKSSNNDATIICSLKNYTIPYGVVNYDEKGELLSFQEKPQMSFFTNTGYYILEKTVLDYIDEAEKIDMPEILNRMKTDGRKVGIYPIGENSWLDMGQFDSMEGMERRLRELNLF